MHCRSGLYQKCLASLLTVRSRKMELWTRFAIRISDSFIDCYLRHIVPSLFQCSGVVISHPFHTQWSGSTHGRKHRSDLGWATRVGDQDFLFFYFYRLNVNKGDRCFSSIILIWKLGYVQYILPLFFCTNLRRFKWRCVHQFLRRLVSI